MTSIANTPPPVATPAAAVAAATTPAVPANVPPATLSLAQMNESNVPANVYNELNEQIKLKSEALSKQLEEQKKDYVLLGMSLAAQKELASTIASNPELLTELDARFKEPVQSFATQYTERNTADPVFGAADQKIFERASDIVGVSLLSRKRASPSADTTMSITKRAENGQGAPVNTQGTFDNGLQIANRPPPSLSTPAKPVDILASLDASLSTIGNSIKTIGMRPNGTLSMANYAANANQVDFNSVRVRN